MNAASDTAPADVCGECGGALVSGTCPACAFMLLLDGGLERWPEAAGSPGGASHMEFGRYTLIRKLATGGMGVVYVAEDRMLKRTVALKMIRGMFFAGAGDVARFKVEAEAAAGLDHPNIVPIYEVGEFEGQPFFTMKWIGGESLAHRLQRAGQRLPAREVAVLVAAIARAVHHAHQRGVLHRDLKPANILLDESGQPWLTDFGLAKLVNEDAGLTLSTDHLGTLHYMSPEVAGGGAAHQASTAADVWALGVILWEMLSGSLPFQGAGTVETLRRIADEEPVWPSGVRVDADLQTLARRCLEKKPERRLASAAALANDLDRWLRGEPVKARPVTRGERFIKWVRRNPAMAALYSLGILAVLVGIFLLQRAERAVVSLTKSNASLEAALRISTATKLAGDARLQVREDPNRALLLAVEAVEMTEHTPAGTLPEAASALMGVLTEAGGWDATPGGLLGDYVEAQVRFGDFHRSAAQISPDGRWLLCLDRVKWDAAPTPAAVYDLERRHGRGELRRWEIWGAGDGTDVPVQAWMPDSKRVISVDGKGRVKIWAAVSGTVDQGNPDSGLPFAEDCGVLSVTDGMTLKDAHLRVAPDGVSIFWLECTQMDPAAADGLRKLRVVRSRVTPLGVREEVSLTVPQGSGRCSISHVAPGGQWVALHDPEGSLPTLLADLSGSTAVVHPVNLPGTVMEVEFDAGAENMVISLADNTLYHTKLPAPGAVSGEITLRRVAEFPAILRRINVSPDGRWLALAGDSRAVHLIPLDQPDPVPVVHEFSSDGGMAVKFSQDGKWLAAGGVDRRVYLWKMEAIRTSAAPLLLRGMPSTIGEIIFSSDAESVAAVGFGSVVRFWHLDGVSGAAMPLRLASLGSDVLDSVVSPDGQWVAAACGHAQYAQAPGRAKAVPGRLLFQRADGRHLLELGGFGPAATGVAFSREGRWLAGTGADGTVKVWACREAVTSAMNGAPPPAPQHVFIIPDIRTTFAWRVEFHPDGRLFMVNGDGVLFCWDLASPDPAASMKSESIHSNNYLLPEVRVSPDGRYLAVARHGWDQPEPGKEQYGAQVFLYDVSRAEWPLRRVALLQSDFLEKTQLVFSPDSRWLACGSAGYAPCLWDLQAANISASRLRVPVLAPSTTGVGFSPKSDRLAIGTGDGQLYLWDWQNAPDLRYVQTGAGIHRLTWLPDGRILASGETGQLALWDSDLGRLKSLARDVAGRRLSDAERKRFHLP